MTKTKIPKKTKHYTEEDFRRGIPEYIQDDIIDWHKKGNSVDTIVNFLVSEQDYEAEPTMSKKLVRAFVNSLPKNKKEINKLEQERGRKTDPTTGETVWLDPDKKEEADAMWGFVRG